MPRKGWVKITDRPIDVKNNPVPVIPAAPEAESKNGDENENDDAETMKPNEKAKKINKIKKQVESESVGEIESESEPGNDSSY